MSYRIHSRLAGNNLEHAAGIDTSEIRHLLIGRELMEASSGGVGA